MTDTTHISTVNADNFQSEIIDRSQSTLILVDFWAGWCNPCKMLMPVLEKLAVEYEGKFHLAKIDTEKEKGLAEKYGIRSLPTVKLFKLGDVIDEFNGVLSESNIREFIDKHQVSDADVHFQSALAALEAGDQNQAIILLEDLIENNPTHANAIMLLARIELLQGQHEKVEALLKQLPLQNVNDALAQEIKTLNYFSREIADVKDINQLKQQAATSDDLLLKYQLGCLFALNKDYEKSLEIFIAIMETERAFKEDGARKNILAIFGLLGSTGPLVNIYRVKMSRLLH